MFVNRTYSIEALARLGSKFQLIKDKGWMSVPRVNFDYLEEAELIDERPEERLSTKLLEPYLRSNLPGITGEFRVAQFGGGHANLTYLIQFTDRSFVLRRQPLGPVVRGAHDMEREYRVLSKLHDVYPLAPRGFLYCAATEIIGAAFVVIERRSGFVIRRRLPDAFQNMPELNLRIGNMLIDNLAALHLVNYDSIGLASLGNPIGYVSRQMEGWTRRWDKAVTETVPRIDQIVKWLQSSIPSSSQRSILHNDYKLDNLLVSSTDPAIATAVLDWDMATLGDPLMDLGHLLNYWVEPGDDPEWREAASMPTWNSGFPTRQEAIERYRTRTGFDLNDLQWFQVFAVFKVIVILQQIYVRYLRGQTKDDRFQHFGDRINLLTQKAESLILQQVQ